MHFMVIGLILLGIVFLPGMWVRHVLAKYAEPEDRYSSTGAQTARELLDRHGLRSVKVEETSAGDHYDPKNKAIRLTPGNFAGRSLTAITVAAHEFGHALQDRDGYKPLRLRGQLVEATQTLEKFGAAILMISPIIVALTRAPGVGILVFLGGLMALGTSTLVHLATLPTELDASFNRALPVLEREHVLKAADHHHAREILRAAAFTYVSASLMSLLNIARWIAILRR